MGKLADNLPLISGRRSLIDLRFSGFGAPRIVGVLYGLWVLAAVLVFVQVVLDGPGLPGDVFGRTASFQTYTATSLIVAYAYLYVTSVVTLVAAVLWGRVVLECVLLLFWIAMRLDEVVKLKMEPGAEG